MPSQSDMIEGMGRLMNLKRRDHERKWEIRMDDFINQDGLFPYRAPRAKNPFANICSDPLMKHLMSRMGAGIRRMDGGGWEETNSAPPTGSAPPTRPAPPTGSAPPTGAVPMSAGVRPKPRAGSFSAGSGLPAGMAVFDPSKFASDKAKLQADAKALEAKMLIKSAIGKPPSVPAPKPTSPATSSKPIPKSASASSASASAPAGFSTPVKSSASPATLDEYRVKQALKSSKKASLAELSELDIALLEEDFPDIAEVARAMRQERLKKAVKSPPVQRMMGLVVQGAKGSKAPAPTTDDAETEPEGAGSAGGGSPDSKGSTLSANTIGRITLLDSFIGEGNTLSYSVSGGRIYLQYKREDGSATTWNRLTDLKELGSLKDQVSVIYGSATSKEDRDWLRDKLKDIQDRITAVSKAMSAGASATVAVLNWYEIT